MDSQENQKHNRQYKNLNNNEATEATVGEAKYVPKKH
jgi:hypothetical protein